MPRFRRSINYNIIEDKERYADYIARIHAVKAALNEMGFGAQSDMARDLGSGSPWVSLVLNYPEGGFSRKGSRVAPVVSLGTLEVMERWVAENRATYKDRRLPVTERERVDVS